MNKIELTQVEEWKEVLDTSAQQKVFIFKHSTTCPVSAEAWKEFERYLQGEPKSDVRYVYVKVIESRPVSNQIAEDLDVKHESPQAILVDHKQAQWHTSHWNITKNTLTEALS